MVGGNYNQAELKASTVNMFTRLGRKHVLFLLTILPDRLKSLSEATLVALMHKILLASIERWGSCL